MNIASMPWTLERYPASMRRLAPEVRAKAIAIAKASLWGLRHGAQVPWADAAS